MTQTQLRLFADQRLVRATANQEPLQGELDLYGAMARALKYNLDAKVEIAEKALRGAELNLSSYEMLPQLVSSTNYLGRSQADPSAVATQDDSYFAGDLTLSWNILDFGLSYVRARQAADKVLVQEETKRKVVNKVIEDVRTAYWRAVSYERLVDRMRALETRVRNALANTRKLATGGQTSPLTALTYERDLLQIQRELETLEGQLRIAKNQLAALINVEPGSAFKLVVPPRRQGDLRLDGDAHAMIRTALANRPEMREAAYQLRIEDSELDAALLSLLPSLGPSAGLNYDTNAFVDTGHWVSWGAQVSWNLMKVFSLPATKRKIDAEKAMLDQRSLSVAMAVMTQVHVSRVRFYQGLRELRTASELANVQHRLLDQMRAQAKAERASEQSLIREEMNTLLSDAKLDMVYADLQNAYANVYSSLGLDPFPPGLSANMSVDAMAAALRDLWLERGGAPAVTRPALAAQPAPAAAAGPTAAPQRLAEAAAAKQ